MLKHKICCIWFIIFMVAITISVFAVMTDTAGGEGGSLYNIGFYLALVLVFACCPICIIDNRVAAKINEYEIKHGMKAQLEQKEGIIAHMDYELERVKTEKQLEIMEKEIELKKREIALREKEEEIKELRRLREELTEDDIKVSKEKHICLVHKGDIRGYSFICPSCGTFYCITCVEAIIDIENACWSCGIEIEESIGSELRKKKKLKGIKPFMKTKSTASAIVEIDPHKAKYCSYCGHPVDPKSKICKECGSHNP